MSDYEFIDDVVNDILTNAKKDKPQKRKPRKVVPVEERCSKLLTNMKICSFKRCSESKYCSRHEKVNQLNDCPDTKNQTTMNDYYKIIE